jgi:hypothetical protein
MRKGMLIAVIGLLVLVALGFALDAYVNRPGRLCYRNYERIWIGMTLTQVEGLLGGPGEEIRREALPKSDHTEPVTGDKFFRWQESAIGKKGIVGLKDDKVCDKWYWEPSL